MNYEQREYQAMNARTSANITLSPRAFVILLVGELAWFGLVIFVSLHQMVTGLPLFLMMLVGLVVPVVLLGKSATPAKEPGDGVKPSD